MSLSSINNAIVNCKKCPLAKLMDAGCVPVIGSGNQYAQIMIVGEAPGYNEMLEGAAFIGRSGKFLTKMLDTAGISRESVYITNTVKCFPRDGKKARPPEKYEIEACKNHLLSEIGHIKPKVIITLGKVPTELLLNVRNTPMKDIAGSIFDYSKDIIILPCWHPSFLMQYSRGTTEKAVEIFRKAKKFCIAEMKRN